MFRCNPKLAYELTRRSNMEDIIPLGNLKLGTIDIILRLAAKNKLLYCVSKELLSIKKIQEQSSIRKKLQKIIYEGDKNLIQQALTINSLKTILKDDLPFLVIKTYKGRPHVEGDIDILVKEHQFKEAVELLCMNKFNAIKSPEPKKMDFFKTGLLRVSLHQEMSWHDIVCVENNVLWCDVRTVTQNDVEYMIPGLEGDLLSLFGHAILETHNIPLNDILYLDHLINNPLDWVLIREQVIKHGWSHSFEKLLNVVNGLRINGSVPFIFPLNHVLVNFCEVTLKRGRNPLDLLGFLRNISEHSYRLMFRSGLPKEVKYLDSFLS